MGSARLHVYAYAVARLSYPKVMQEKCVRGSEGGRVEISRGSGSSVALGVVDRAASLDDFADRAVDTTAAVLA